MQAWTELSKSENDDVWTRFEAQFHFGPSVSADAWPCIDEPSPFITWRVAGPWSDEHLEDLHTSALAAFRVAVPAGTAMFALDWQHTCYAWRPHVPLAEWGVGATQSRLLGPQAAVPDSARWRIPAHPNGDYSIFLTPDLDCGWVGHPWEESICVFGKPLLAAVEQRRPRMFETVLRGG